MVDVAYTHEKLGDAVQVLSTHPGRINERLAKAVEALVMVDEKAFSQPGMYVEAPRFWRSIWEKVTTAPRDKKLGVFIPSIQRLTEEEASQVAQWIVSLDAMVETYMERQT